MTDPVQAALARRMHRSIEPLHAVVYFAQERKAAYEAAGISSRLSYFSSRSAAMGAVPASVVEATFYNFSPAVIAPVIPLAWELASPARILAARADVADGALRRILGETVLQSAVLQEAADLARRATEHCSPSGRPLFAAHASLPWPEQPHLVLWHAATLLREHRGDGHIALLVAAELSGAEALATHHAAGGAPAGMVASRGWSPDEWAATLDGLRRRGILDEDDRLTAAGEQLRERIEHETDRLALSPWAALGEDRCDRLAVLLAPLLQQLAGDAERFYARF